MKEIKSFEQLRLTENSRLTGIDFEKFKKVVKDIDQRTHTVNMRFNFLTLIHASNIKAKDEERKYSGFILNRESLDEFENAGKRPQFVVMHNYMNDELWWEARRSNKLVVLSDPQCDLGQVPMTISPPALHGFLRQIKMDCSAIFSLNNIWRDGTVAYKQLEKVATVNVIYREFMEKVDGQIKKYWKIFYFGSPQEGRHVMIPQEMISAIIMELQGYYNVEVKQWSVTNALTKIYAELPDLATEYKEKYSLPYEMTPGIRIETSDTGESSFCVLGTIKIGDGNPVVISEIKQEHKGVFALETFIPQILNDIFGYYEDYIRKVTNLMDIPYTDSVLSMTERYLKADTKKIPKKITTFIMKNIATCIEEGELDLAELCNQEDTGRFLNEGFERNICESDSDCYMENMGTKCKTVVCDTMLDYFNILMLYGTMYEDTHQETKDQLYKILVEIPNEIINAYIHKIKRPRTRKKTDSSINS